jgi:hypothetical protein
VLRQRIFRIKDLIFRNQLAPEGIQVQHAVAGFFPATFANVI